MVAGAVVVMTVEMVKVVAEVEDVADEVAVVEVAETTTMATVILSSIKNVLWFRDSRFFIAIFRINTENGDDGGDGGENGIDDKPREIYIPPEPSNDENEIFNQGISSGINFDKFDSIPIKVSGSNAPKQINTFESAGLNKFVLDNIAKSKYTRPTPIQKVAIPTILAGRDLMACAQTGSGKTAAFLLPIINKLLEEPNDSNTGCPHVIIISPTRELTSQVCWLLF